MGSTSRAEARQKRKRRVRKRVRGTPEKPRLSVFRSTRHIYAQIVDDANGKTLIECSSLSKELQSELKQKGGNKEGSTQVGAFVAKRASEKGIKRVVFDRNGFLYHGRIKALADSAREHGLEF
jgi:large subunit ribosomal protein L18